MSDGSNEQIKIHQKWGFGMAPPKEHTAALRRNAVRLVLKAMVGADPEDPHSLAKAISEVKGLFNRSRRMDQWDWFVVWQQLGLPERKRVDRIVSGLAVWRKAIRSQDLEDSENMRIQLVNWGALTSLGYFLGLASPPIEPNTGILYMLGTREMKGLLKIGITERDVIARVNEINSATGIPIPLGVRHIWRVRKPKIVEREIHRLLSVYRVRSDREFFQMQYRDAVRVITKFLEETQGLSRERGVVKRLLIENGYGFLTSGGDDFFFHSKEARGSFRNLKPGDTVEFERLNTSLGYAAIDVRRVFERKNPH